MKYRHGTQVYIKKLDRTADILNRTPLTEHRKVGEIILQDTYHKGWMVIKTNENNLILVHEKEIRKYPPETHIDKGNLHKWLIK